MADSQTFPPMSPGAVFAGDYRIVRPLQQGGMGALYVALQLSTGRERALKLMHPQLVTDPVQRQRFEREARVGAGIDSAHVVEVIDAGVDERGVPWLAMELLKGQDLASVLATHGALAPGDVHAVFEQLCHALAAAHAAGVVHRDLKPENVFLAASRQVGAPFLVKILDFGIAKIVAEHRGRDTSPIGTPLWMAPEQTVVGAGIAPATDVWPLGLMAFALLVGRSYWRGAGASASAVTVLREVALEALVAASVRAREFGKEDLLPPGFDAWFARCVVREPEQRFPSAQEAFAALVPVLGAAAAAGAPASSSPEAATLVDPVSLAGFLATVPTPGRAGRGSSLDGLSGGASEPRTAAGRSASPSYAFGATEPDPMPPSADRAADRDEDPGDAAPAGVPRPSAPHRTRPLAFAALGMIGVAGGLVLAARQVLTSAEGAAARMIASAEEAGRKREEVKDQALSRGKVLERRAQLDRLLGDVVRVPAATFELGSEDHANDEKPRHRASVAAFELDATEVTVARYKACVLAGACQAPSAGASCTWGRPDRAQHPVNCVDWEQARAFCAWAAKRLPTEEEWELAAAGTDGRTYPWGSSEPQHEACWRRVGPKGGEDGTCPAGATPAASPYGARDLAGNVAEWTQDAYCPYEHKGCAHTSRVVRGGTWRDSEADLLRASARERRPPGYRGDEVGFRCARDVL